MCYCPEFFQTQEVRDIFSNVRIHFSPLAFETSGAFSASSQYVQKNDHVRRYQKFQRLGTFHSIGSASLLPQYVYHVYYWISH